LNGFGGMVLNRVVECVW